MRFARMMGIMPLGIGLTVLGFVWTQPFGGFGALPLFFRLFMSFIALGFVMVGAQLLFGKLTGPQRLKSLLEDVRSQLPQDDARPGSDQPHSGPVSYQCDNCGAHLETNADVSPHGDVRCAHCDRWFNIHGRS